MRLSLGFILALSLAGLQLIAILIVVFTSFVTSEKALLEQARASLADAGANASDLSLRFLKPARDAAELSSGLIEEGIISESAPEAIESFLFQTLQTEAQLSGIFYGDEAGNFVYVMRSEGPGAFRTKFVFVAGDQRVTELIFRRADFSEVERRFDPDDTYDPRTRPWYKSASQTGASIWTAPYIFFSSQQPGITVASPVKTATGEVHGVIGVDIEISVISGFLAQLKIGKSGVALILNENGDVLAHPDAAQTKVENADGSVRFAAIDEIKDTIARAAFSDLITGGTVSVGQETPAEFKLGRRRYVSLLKPFPDTALPWTIAIYAPESDFTQGIKDNRRRNIWLAALISLGTALVGVVLAELILKPGRAFAVRTALVSQGEVAASEALPRTYRELSRANMTLIDEIAQRRDADARIRELNRDLAHISRVNLMGQMATGLAHELSQPLTAITQNVDAAISTAKEGPAPNQELLGILEELDEQAHRGGDIIRALRGFVRKDESELAPFDLGELLEQTKSLLENEANALDIRIVSATPDPPRVIGNRVQIAQVLINLIRNAMEAMSEANSTTRVITVSARKSGAMLEVRVEDTGPGVSPDARLFKQFETSKSWGLGLGLSICRRILETNDGKLWHDATCTELTRFCFTLRVADTTEPQVQDTSDT